MVEQLTVGPSGSSGTLRRQLSYKINYMKSAQLVQLGQIDKSNLRCMTDDEDHLLLDDGNMIVVGSRMLWNAVFHTLNVKSFFGDGCYKQISKELGAGQSKQRYSVFVEVQGGQALPLFLALIKDSQRATYDRVFKWFHDELAQLGVLYHLTLPGVKFLTDFELGAMKAIESQLGIKVLGCTFHYKKCIYQERDAVVLRSKAASGDIVDTYFRRLGVMPFLAPHIFNISECLPPPRLPSDKPTEALLDNFWTYYRNTWLPLNGIFYKYLDHIQNFDSRIINTVEGSHTRIRATFPDNQFSHLMDMLKYCCGEMTIAKSLTASIANGTLAPRYIRPAEQRRQQEIHGDMRNFK